MSSGNMWLICLSQVLLRDGVVNRRNGQEILAYTMLFRNGGEMLRVYPPSLCFSLFLGMLFNGHAQHQEESASKSISLLSAVLMIAGA